eukprot:CAMPEP_0119478618 /NCGR_PEP_ID=MMETSP1344-20130328/8274_1 /TAXON_ID=236787 /ORGANISM="Florenciella parvula, Strain CCMP2471" /LENGTH=466 /DNA_ID=CAMNT_0007512803 /DNA_START=80 /DNA_END=1483 /DNA_ORIENTATION=+
MEYHGNNIVSKQNEDKRGKGGAGPKRNAGTSDLSDTLRGCAKMGDIAGLRAVLELGDAAEAIDSADDVGYTALMLACKYDRDECVAVLVEAGANTDIVTKVGSLPYSKAGLSPSKSVPRPHPTTPIHGHAHAPLSCIGQKHWSALLFASKFGHFLCANTLLENGASVEGATVEGTTALMLTSKFGHEETMELLLTKRPDLERVNGDGFTALHWAAWNGRLECARLLINANADLHATDKYRMTALDRAKEEGQQAMGLLGSHNNGLNESPPCAPTPLSPVTPSSTLVAGDTPSQIELLKMALEAEKNKDHRVASAVGGSRIRSQGLSAAPSPSNEQQYGTSLDRNTALDDADAPSAKSKSPGMTMMEKIRAQKAARKKQAAANEAQKPVKPMSMAEKIKAMKSKNAQSAPKRPARTVKPPSPRPTAIPEYGVGGLSLDEQELSTGKLAMPKAEQTTGTAAAAAAVSL